MNTNINVSGIRINSNEIAIPVSQDCWALLATNENANGKFKFTTTPPTGKSSNYEVSTSKLEEIENCYAAEQRAREKQSAYHKRSNDEIVKAIIKAESTDAKMVLAKRFVKFEEFGTWLNMCIRNGRNGIAFGPGGFGKSDFVRAFIKEAGIEEDTFIMQFNKDTKVADLWGGIDFKALNKGSESEMRFLVENSFLKYPFVIFEEFFDAPPAVLASLKNTLQEKQLQAGSQRSDLRTHCILALTNKTPEEIQELGDWAKALTERFPYVINVKWNSYEPKDYMALFKKVGKCGQGKTSDDDKLKCIAEYTAELLGSMSAEGKIVSPRMALYAIEAAQAEGKRDKFAKDLILYLRALKFVDGFGSNVQSMLEGIEESIILRKIAEELHDYEQKFKELQKKRPKTFADSKALLAEFESLKNLAKDMQTCEEIHEGRVALINQIDVAQKGVLEEMKDEILKA